MPELPEVETTLQGLKPHILNKKICKVIVRQPKLRWPVISNISSLTRDKTILSCSRRAKYLLLELENGYIILHLGMSGKLRIASSDDKVQKHDHVDIVLDNKNAIRFTDHRRFGCVLWSKEEPEEHKLLKNLGPEPLTCDFNTNYLFSITNKRNTPIKSLIMNNKHVVGVGNIYACESLFLSKIDPRRKASTLSKDKVKELVKNIKLVLKAAIKAGGTSFRDFLKSDGNPGYFKQKLKVYGKKAESCNTCKTPIESVILAQRNTFFCPNCQT